MWCPSSGTQGLYGLIIINDQKPKIGVICLRGVIEVTPTMQHIYAYVVMPPLSGKYALFMPNIVPTYNQTPILSYRNELSISHSTTHIFVSIILEKTYFRPLNYVEFVERSPLSVELYEQGFSPELAPVCVGSGHNIYTLLTSLT